MGGKNCASRIFLDLQKAFNSLNTKILLLKLEKVGETGSALLWITDYPASEKSTGGNNLNQNIKTEFKTKLSSCVKYRAQGVSQGSVLGLLLFLFNINSSLVELEAPQKCAIFARKTTVTIPLYCQSDDLKKLRSALNTA